jgi:hypothetical protein
MRKRLRPALIACVLGACALGAAAGAARAEAPAKPVWTVPVEPDEGFKLGFYTALALHADGTALLAIDQERMDGQDTIYRPLLISVAADGRVLHRSAPQPESRHYIRGVKLAAEADGFALFTNRGEPEQLVVYRLARDGRVRATHPVRVRGEPMQEISGIAADGRGNLLVYGGGFDGPHSPALAMLNPAGRILWSFVGKQPMPPGGVRTVRFRVDGGTDALVIDREKLYWERRSAAGALALRARLPFGGDCWGFLDGRRLAHLFFHHEARAEVKAPAQRWVLGLHGENGRLMPGHVVLDAPAGIDARCRLAIGGDAGAGWIAAALGPPKIALFDFGLAPRGALDLSAQSATEIDVLAIDAKGIVTVLIDTHPQKQPGRKLVLLRLAPPMR